jgi:thioredoxin 1
MKKVFLISLFASLLVFTTCSTNGGNNADDKNLVPDNGTVIRISSDMFQKLVWNYKSDPNNFKFAGDLPVIVDFYADWCRPCKMVGPILEDLAKQYSGKIRVYKVNVDSEKELSAMFNIQSIPAILYAPKEGKPSMSVGLQSRDAYEQAIHEVLKVK